MLEYSLAGQRRFKSPGAGSYVVGLATGGPAAGPGDTWLAAAVAGAQGSLEVLALPSLAPLRSFAAPHGPAAPSDVVRLAAASCFASCGTDGAVKLWDVRAHGDQPVRVLRTGGPDEVATLAISPDDHLCAFSMGSRIHIVDVASGKPLHVHEDAHSEPVTRLRFRPSRPRELLSAGDDGLLCALAVDRCLQGGSAVEDDAGLRLVMNGVEPTRSLSFLGEDSAVVACVSTTEVLRLWCLDERKPGASCGRFEDLRSSQRLQVSESDGYIVDALYHEVSGRAVAFGGAVDGTLSLFHLNLEAWEFAGTLPAAHAGVVRAAVPLRDGAFVTAGEDGRVCLWSPATRASPGQARKRASDGGGGGKRRLGRRDGAC